MAKHMICKESELPPGERKIVEVGRRSIGVFNVNGAYYAIRNSCPHQAAPLCQGKVTGTALPSQPGEYLWGREGEVVRCPWHGWEFDITTGRSVFNPHKLRVKSYEVTVEKDAAAQESGQSEILGNTDAEFVESYPVTVEDGLVILHA